MANIHPVRVGLYVALALFSCVVFGLSGARLYYTTHLPRYDPLNHGIPFYDPIVAELIVTSFLTLLWCLSMSCIISKSYEGAPIRTFRGEFIGIFILWVMWLVGAAYSTHIWGNLKFCWQFKACKLLTALVAFVWISWITLTFVFVVSIIFVAYNKSFTKPLHGRYYYDAEGRHIGTSYEEDMRERE
ncbi:hypothetical protein DL96DRAFT_1667140 [Flagelloscypha sp. PMI_526]|nr:hypothetical protein DL96DRAFT_1667140 [Flagelloscypha sp. PMI_526]